MKTRISKSRYPAVAAVHCNGGFKNQIGDLVFFDSAADAETYASRWDGKVVNEAALALLYENAHRAGGRIPNQSSNGGFQETPVDADPNWQENVWQREYAVAAAGRFRDAQVYQLEYFASEFTVYASRDRKHVRVESPENSNFWVLYEIDGDQLPIIDRGPAWDDAAADAAKAAAESELELTGIL